MTLRLLRLAFADESAIPRMTASAPPVVVNISEHTAKDGHTYFEYEPFEEPPAAIGQSLSAALISLIGNITSDAAFYGPRHPVRRALSEYDRICRRRHRLPTWTDHPTPICGEMLRARVEGGASIIWCANRYGISYPRAERLLAAGEEYVNRSLIEAEARLLGINVRAHGIDCPSPATCPICSVDYSPSKEAKVT